MKAVYHHYTTWEDFQHGMYDEEKEGRKDRVLQAVSILTNRNLLYTCMKRVTEEWTHATEQNLSNDMYGHRSFLGQAACSIYAGIHEDETREAWGLLTEEQRYIANRIADQVYHQWKDNYLKEIDHCHQQSLFE